MTAAKGAHPVGTPLAEIDVGAALVHRLIAAQHPDLAHLPVVLEANGWDNAIFRLGDRLSVRLPRRAAAAQPILNEQRWLPTLVDILPLAIPAPHRVGVPGSGYPWAWSITPWFKGQTADLHPPGLDQSEVLAGFFKALHKPAPASAPRNPFRGVRLAERTAAFDRRLAALAVRSEPLDPRLLHLWEAALAAPVDVQATWIHGDLHPRNILVVDCQITAVIDWGDMAQGDRAADLAALWMLLPGIESRRRAMFACSSVSDATWRRARGWAVFYGVMLLETGLADDPRMAAIARQTFQHLLAGS